MKWKADTNAENMGVEEADPRRPYFVVTGKIQELEIDDVMEKLS